MFALNFYLLVVLKLIRERLPSPLFMPSTVFLLNSFTMFSPFNNYMVLPPLTLISRFLVVHVLCYYNLMNIPNLNHMLVYVVSWAMVLNIKDFVVGIWLLI